MCRLKKYPGCTTGFKLISLNNNFLRLIGLASFTGCVVENRSTGAQVSDGHCRRGLLATSSVNSLITFMTILRHFWKANMLDFAIFAVTFVIILIGAVLYLYPVKNINIILSVFVVVVIMFYMNYTFESLLNMFNFKFWPAAVRRSSLD